MERKAYSTDMTDAEWTLVEPLMPVVEREGGRWVDPYPGWQIPQPPKALSDRIQRENALPLAVK